MGRTSNRYTIDSSPVWKMRKTNLGRQVDSHSRLWGCLPSIPAPCRHCKDMPHQNKSSPAAFCGDSDGTMLWIGVFLDFRQSPHSLLIVRGPKLSKASHMRKLSATSNFFGPCSSFLCPIQDTITHPHISVLFHSLYYFKFQKAWNICLDSIYQAAFFNEWK